MSGATVRSSTYHRSVLLDLLVCFAVSMLLNSMAYNETNGIEIVQVKHEPFVKDCILMISFKKIANPVFSISFDVLFM